MFSEEVEVVSDTSICARMWDAEEQLLVYEMTLSSLRPVAMVLPLPIDPTSPDDALSFINLEDHGNFFSVLRGFFVRPSEDLDGSGEEFTTLTAAALPVHDVGDFEASFVPRRADFSRLDPRFQLSDGVWRALGEYRDYGFAVFQLRVGSQRVHPMAFRFRTRAPNSLFFPTLHVHDRTVPAVARFDHTLYMQAAPAAGQAAPAAAALQWDERTSPDHPVQVEGFSPPGWESAMQPPSGDLVEEGLLSRFALSRRVITGIHSNQDIWVRI